MIQHRDISSEEKLLKLLREKKDTNSKKSPLKDKFKKDHDSIETTEQQAFKVLNSVLIGLSVVFLCVSFYNFFFLQSEKNSISKAVEELHEENIPSLKLEPKPFEYYAQKIEQRDFFSASDLQEPASIFQAVMDPQATSDLTKQLKIVGIVLGETKEVIIEDLQTKQTFFLNEGGLIKEATVKEIQEDKIILFYNGEELELSQ